MRNGESVAAFEKSFAEYVGAKYAIALCNGTATLHTALVALGVKPGDKVAVPPLTMSATTIAVLQAGAVPVFVDVAEDTWLMTAGVVGCDVVMPVSLYGLHHPCGFGFRFVDDAAQTLRPHNKNAAFTSYSFQASKILALGEGGMLVTNDEELATKARSFSSLGYKLDPKSPRIDPSILKSPDYERHHTYPAWNYRMNDVTAEKGLRSLGTTWIEPSSEASRIPIRTPALLLQNRREAASLYREAIKDCDWITPQYVPEGWTCDYWAFAFAVAEKSLWHPLVDAMVRHGAEMPFGAWKLTYQEPAFRHLAPDGTCPVAENLQPRILQCQTNDLASAERNATALRKAIAEIGGSQ